MLAYWVNISTENRSILSSRAVSGTHKAAMEYSNALYIAP